MIISRFFSILRLELAAYAVHRKRFQHLHTTSTTSRSVSTVSPAGHHRASLAAPSHLQDTERLWRYRADERAALGWLQGHLEPLLDPLQHSAPLAPLRLRQLRGVLPGGGEASAVMYFPAPRSPETKIRCRVTPIKTLSIPAPMDARLISLPWFTRAASLALLAILVSIRRLALLVTTQTSCVPQL